MDLKEVENKLKGLTDNLTHDLSTRFKEAQETLNSIIKPIEEKSVNINGVNCVVQLLKDGVKIIHPDPKSHYDKIVSEKKECWLKKFIKGK